MDLKSMTSSELVALYNKHAAKPVKKFESRAVAERRVAAVLPPEPPVVVIPANVEKLVVRTRSAGIEDSWKDPVIAAKRSERYGVKADGQEYRSVMSAFLKLKLNTKDVIRLRMALVAHGRPIEHEGHVFELV